MRTLSSALVLGALVWGLVSPARGADARELTRVEIKGTLSVVGIIPHIGPPRVHVTLITRRRTYQLAFKNEQERKLVEKLGDRIPVVVSGWMIEGRVIQVIGLKKQNGTVVIPETIKVTVRVVRTPGVGDFGPRRHWALDSAKLSATEVARLCRLIDSVRFFKLRSSPLSLCIPDPPVGYEVTVTLDGRQHTIWVEDAAVTKGLRQLIDHVRRTA